MNIKKIIAFVELVIVAIAISVITLSTRTVTTDNTPQEVWWIRRRTPTATIRILTPTLVPSITPSPSSTPTQTPTITPDYPGTPMPGKVMQCWLIVEIDGVRRPILRYECPSSIWYYSPNEQPSTTIVPSPSKTPSR